MAETMVKALVLSSRDVGENDKLVKLFSLENGIIEAKLVGVRKQNAKLKLFKEPFCFAEFSLTQKGNFFIVTNADLLDSFHTVSSDVDVFFSACEMVKLIEKTNPKGEKNPAVFILFLRALKALAYDQVQPQTVLLKFMTGMLEKMGYPLTYSSCAVCGQKFVKVYLNKQTGEIICGDCKRSLPIFGNDACELSLLVLSTIRLICESDFEKLKTLKLQSAGVCEAICLLKSNIEQKVCT